MVEDKCSSNWPHQNLIYIRYNQAKRIAGVVWDAMHIAPKRRGVKGEYCVKSPGIAVKETRGNQTPLKKTSNLSEQKNQHHHQAQADYHLKEEFLLSEYP